MNPRPVFLAALAAAIAVYWEVVLNWDSNDTREFRAKNPLGVSTSTWTQSNGQSGEDNSLNDHLAIMPNMRAGANAASDLLYNAYFNNGYNTALTIGTKWSGDSTTGYGTSVAEIMGVDPNSALNFLTDGDNLMRAMAKMENGAGPGAEILATYFDPSIIRTLYQASA